MNLFYFQDIENSEKAVSKLSFDFSDSLSLPDVPSSECDNLSGSLSPSSITSDNSMVPLFPETNSICSSSSTSKFSKLKNWKLEIKRKIKKKVLN